MRDVAIHLFFGDDEMAVAAKARSIVDAALPPEQQTWGLEVIDGSAESPVERAAVLDSCIEAIQTVSFLAGGKKVIWLRGAVFLGESPESHSDAVKIRLKRLQSALSSLATGVIVVVTAGKVDKRAGIVRVFKDRGEVVEFAAPEKAGAARDWARRRLKDAFKARGVDPSEGVIDLVLDKTGCDSRQIENEAEKLFLYAGDRGVLRLQDVHAIVSATREVPTWDLADAFGRRDLKRSLRVLRDLIAQKLSVPRLLMDLGMRVQDLLLYHTAIARGWYRLGDRSGGWARLPPEAEQVLVGSFDRDPREAHPYRAWLLATQSQNFTREELERCLDLIHDAHARIVSSGVEDRIVLELLLVRALRR